MHTSMYKLCYAIKIMQKWRIYDRKYNQQPQTMIYKRSNYSQNVPFNGIFR